MREREARQRETWGQETIVAAAGPATTPDPALSSAATLAAEARQIADEKSISIAEAMLRVMAKKAT